MKKIKRKISSLFKVLNIINKITYKRKKYVVFYSNRGFRDNLTAVYDYMIEHNYNEQYKIICSVNDFYKFKHQKIKNVKFVNNYIGLLYFLTSKYFFYTHGKYPIKPSEKQVVINLWHGTPLKKIGNLESHQKDIDYNFFTYILATSEKFADIMQKAFSCDKNQVKICGHPRNDLLFKPVSDEVQSDKKLILWLPTHRNYEKSMELTSSKTDGNIPLFHNDIKMKNLDLKLEKLKIKLIIKLHPTQQYKGTEYKTYKNIKIYSEKEFSKKGYHLYQLLGSSDALITDYSSVYFDYLLLDRPIGFTVNDIELYNSERGFVFNNPEEFMPGFKIDNIESFYLFLENISNGIDEFKNARSRVNNIVNYYTDGNNSKRVLEIANIKI